VLKIIDKLLISHDVNWLAQEYYINGSFGSERRRVGDAEGGPQAVDQPWSYY
jgi:hypothetical protein